MSGFEQLEAQLRGAVATRASTRRRPFRRRSPLLALVAALILGGSATAAVVSLTAQHSQPLSGRLPGLIEPASTAGLHYRITVTPDLSAGDAGWATALTYWTRGAEFSGGGGSGGGYASATNPIFAGSIDGFACCDPQRYGDQVSYVLVAPNVVAVRVGGQTVRTFASAQLPAGDRAAVFFEPLGPLLLMSGWRPGARLRSVMHDPGFGRPVPQLTLVPLDRAGRPIPAGDEPGYSVSTSFWQSPAALTPTIHEPPYHGPTRPGRGVCALHQAAGAGLIPAWGHTVTALAAVPDARGELFLSCVNTEYYLHGWPLDAAVLVDARHPGAVPGAIPGARPVPDRRGVVDLEAGALTAVRRGRAWLAVEGGANLAMRLRVIAALSAAVDLGAIH